MCLPPYSGLKKPRDAFNFCYKSVEQYQGVKEGTGTKIVENEMNTIEIASSRFRDCAALIELLVKIAMFPRQGVCSSDNVGYVSELARIAGHSVCSLFLLLFASALNADGGPGGPQFAVQDLGPLEATLISIDGRVLGNGTGAKSSWLWMNGQRVELNLDGASAVNRNGYVLGQVYAGDYQDGFGDFVSYSRASLWHNAALTELGTLGGRSSWAVSLNGSQVVVGVADDPANVPHPFTWQDGVMTSIRVNFPTAAGWQFDAPLRITDDGRIFGTGRLLNVQHAVRLSRVADGSYDLVDLGALSGIDPSVNAFNDFGWATGEACFAPEVHVEAFLFKAGTTIRLGNLGSPGSYGFGENNAGDVVGSSNSESYRAFLWRDGTIYDLNSCIPVDSGWVLVSANGINDSGQIVGHGILNGTGTINQGRIVNGGHRGFLLNPMAGTDQGLNVQLQGRGGHNQWLVALGRQPTTKVHFEVSTDLVHWSVVAHSDSGRGFLIEGPDSEAGFFRAVFNP